MASHLRCEIYSALHVLRKVFVCMCIEIYEVITFVSSSVFPFDSACSLISKKGTVCSYGALMFFSHVSVSVYLYIVKYSVYMYVCGMKLKFKADFYSYR